MLLHERAHAIWNNVIKPDLNARLHDEHMPVIEEYLIQQDMCRLFMGRDAMIVRLELDKHSKSYKKHEHDYGSGRWKHSNVNAYLDVVVWTFTPGSQYRLPLI